MEYLKWGAYASLFAILFSFNSLAGDLPSQDSLVWRQWQALLHYHGGELRIADPAFILSSPKFSLEAEWAATLQLFLDRTDKSCRFPARYRLMSTWYGNGFLPNLPLCKDYVEFLNRVPADTISLVYASENLVNPSSMMGHVMLAIEGKRDDGFLARHSVSFLTELNSVNPFSIVWDTLIKGKSGYFLVKPLREHYKFYNLDEQRNVWRYILRLNDYQRALIQDHIWELKHPTIIYYFHKHNCATLIFDILKLPSPGLHSSGWITPVDVTKSVNEFGLIESAEITPASKWKIKMLSEALPESSVDNVYDALYQGEPWHRRTGEAGYIEAELINTVVQYRHETDQFPISDIRNNEAEYKSKNMKNDYFIDLTNYKSPLRTPDDSQFSMGIYRANSDDWYSLRWLPADHGIDDNNHAYFGENELKLSEITININAETGHAHVHKFQLYSAMALTPSDKFTRGKSGYLRFGYYPQYDLLPELTHGVEVAGGLGTTYKVNQDVGAYAILGAGYSLGDKQGIFLEPELGAYFYLVGNIKSFIRYQPRNYLDDKWLDKLQIIFSLDLGDSAVTFESTRYLTDDEDLQVYSLNWTKYH